MAKTLKVAVKSGNPAAVVGYAEYQEFESIQEAVSVLGDKDILDLINTQHATNAKNKVRAEATRTPSMETFRTQATAALGQLPDTEVIALVRDPAKYGEWITNKANELKGAWETDRDARLAKLAAEQAAEAAGGDSN